MPALLDSNMHQMVTGAQLIAFTGKKVSIIGVVEQCDTNSFTIRSVDDLLVPIRVKEPLDGPLEGYVEVIGISQGKSVTASQYISFDNGAGAGEPCEDFDAKAHVLLCKLLNSVPNLWDVKQN